MEHHLELSDQDFITSFEKSTIDPGWFTHMAHLRIAYLYIQNYGHKKAARRLCFFIEAFDKEHGKGDKFHKTITCASVSVVTHFMQKAKQEGFLELLKEFSQLQHSFKELLLVHYSPLLLGDDRSRRHYFLPDKASNPVFELAG